MNIYAINAEINAILEAEPDENGELNIDLDALDSLQIEKEIKTEDLIKAHLNYKRTVEGFKSEVKSLQERQRTSQNRMDSTKAYIDLLHGGEKATYGNHAVSYLKSVSVSDGAVDILPDIFVVLQDPRPDKTGLKTLLKSGVYVPEWELIEKQNIQIK